MKKAYHFRWVNITFVFIAILGAPLKEVAAQECDKAGGTLAGAVIGGSTGSLVGKGKGKKAATIGGAVIGGAVGAKRDEEARARCLEDREVSMDRAMQRQLEYERQSTLQQEQLRREIEEQKLYEEWKKERLNSLE